MNRLFGNNVEFNLKNSSSPSICIKAKTVSVTPTSRVDYIFSLTDPDSNPDNFRYFFKIWPVLSTIPDVFKDSWSENINGINAMKYELEVYKRLINVGLNSDSNIIPIIGHSETSISISELLNVIGRQFDFTDNRDFSYIFYRYLRNNSIPKDIDDVNIEAIDEEYFELSQMLLKVKYNFIILPYINKITTVQDRIQHMNKVLIKKYSPDNEKYFYSYIQELMIIMFNIFEGVNILHSRNIQHNDLHLSNVFVRENNTIFIYDFDRSFCPPLGDNPFLSTNPCEFPCNIGQCNILHSSVDVFKILISFMLLNNTKKVIVEYIFKNIFFEGLPENQLKTLIKILNLSNGFRDSDNCNYVYSTKSIYHKDFIEIIATLGANPLVTILERINNVFKKLGMPQRRIYQRSDTKTYFVDIPGIKWFFSKSPITHKKEKSKNPNRKLFPFKSKDFGKIVAKNDYKKELN